jgi:fused signal recognition particle receptor
MIRWLKKRKGTGGDGAPLDSAAAPEEELESALEPEEQQAEGPALEIKLEQSPISEAESSLSEAQTGAGDAAPPEAAAEDLEDLGETRERPRFFRQLRERLHKTREQMSKRVDRVVLGKKVINEELLEDLEEALITSDLGVRTATVLLERVAEKVQRKELTDPARLRAELQEHIRSILDIQAPPLDVHSNRPFVIMVAGVNGVGKTTTIGKLAARAAAKGQKVLIAAADTFRAAAIEQLTIWAQRAGADIVRHKDGADPAAVAYDAIEASLARNVDLVLVDTAGRLHTKVNLMEELKKIKRTIAGKLPGAPHESLLVLDATTGQNALSQAKLFHEDLGVTGLVLTKLDGTAKGGIVVSICSSLDIPLHYIGVGEKIDDLQEFVPEEFVEALF